MEQKNPFASVRYPLLGAAYYPEAWPEEAQPRDIAMMGRAGITVVRIGEFAWKKMEPREGEFDFQWLHRVINRLEEAGIRVILGTPSATPPLWLEEMDPEMRMVKENGMAMQHGGRRHCCSNNPTYRRYSARIAERLVREFGRHPNVIGWQIDNEIAAFDGCWCSHCRKGFAEYLKKRYTTIENLNAQWNLNLFSQTYDRFDQIPRPLPHTWHSPHLKFEWNRFLAQSHVDFVKMQADIMHQYTAAPVGTDMMPVFNEDYEQMNAFLDVVQYNHYDDEQSISRELFWFDYMRGVKDRPFWVTETATCWNGATSTPSNLRPEGFCRLNSWLPVVLGAEANLYWLWRQHWAGHELMHGAVLYASGQPMHIFPEVRQSAAEFEICGEFLSNTRIKTDFAMMVSSRNDYLMKEQEVVWEEGSHAWETAYTKRLYKAYQPLAELGIRPDVIPPGKDLSKYRLLYTPFLLTLEEADLPERIEAWVRQGGTWIAGPMTDIRNHIGAHYQDRETGILERLTGAKLLYQVPDGEHRVPCRWNDGSPFRAEKWLQLFDAPEDAQVLVTADGYYSALAGKALVFRKQLGKGTILVLGTLPSQEDGMRLLRLAMSHCGAAHFTVEGMVAAAYREGEGLRGISAAEYGGKPGTLFLDGRYLDLLTGKTYTGRISFAPYQIAILIKQED